MSSENSVNEYDVLVIGGGAAGVGVSIALMHAGIENFAILDLCDCNADSRFDLDNFGR